MSSFYKSYEDWEAKNIKYVADANANYEYFINDSKVSFKTPAQEKIDKCTSEGHCGMCSYQNKDICCLCMGQITRGPNLQNIKPKPVVDPSPEFEDDGSAENEDF